MSDKAITIKGTTITVSNSGEDKVTWLVYDFCVNVIAHGTTKPLKFINTTEKGERVYEVDNVQILIGRGDSNE